MISRSSCTLALLLATLSAGCVPSSPEPVSPDGLPAEARFSSMGNTGQVYRVRSSWRHAEFGVDPRVAGTLLPATIRLFRYQPGDSAWIELGDSRFDSTTSLLAGQNLAPGYYTGFGFSTDPATNALQRVALDGQLGYGSRGTASLSPAQVWPHIAGAPQAERLTRLHDVMGQAVTVPQTTCWTLDTLALSTPDTCRAPGVTYPYPWSGSECPPNPPYNCPRQCCVCRTIPVGLYIPKTLAIQLPRLCLPGRWPCGYCPDGLSCGARSALSDLLRPRGDVVSLAVMDSFPLLRDVRVLPEFHTLATRWVEGVVGLNIPRRGQ